MFTDCASQYVLDLNSIDFHITRLNVPFKKGVNIQSAVSASITMKFIWKQRYTLNLLIVYGDIVLDYFTHSLSSTFITVLSYELYKPPVR